MHEMSALRCLSRKDSMIIKEMMMILTTRSPRRSRGRGEHHWNQSASGSGKKTATTRKSAENPRVDIRAMDRTNQGIAQINMRSSMGFYFCESGTLVEKLDEGVELLSGESVMDFWLSCLLSNVFALLA